MSNTKTILSGLSSALFFALAIFQMTVFSALTPVLMNNAQLSETTLGFLSSIYFYGAAVSLIPFGFFLDHFPMRKLILAFALILFLAILFFAIHPSIFSAIIYRALCGIINSLAFLGCMRQANIFFKNHLGIAISVMITIGMLGGLMQTPFIMYVTHFGIHAGLYLNIFITGFVLSFMVLVLRDSPNVHYAQKSKTQSLLLQLGQHVKLALAIRENWICGFFAGLLNLPVTVLGAFFGGYYLSHAYHLTTTQSAFINSMIFLGMIIASPMIGFSSELLKSRKAPMMMGSLLIVILAIFLLFFHGGFLLLTVLFFLIGMSCTTQILSYSVVAELNPPTLSSTALSVVSMILYLVGAAGSPIFGYLLSLGKNYQSPFLPVHLFFIASFLLAFLLSILVKESFKKI